MKKGPLNEGYFFNWWKIALQFYVGFCHTTTRISHIYIYIYIYTHIPSVLSLPLPYHPCRNHHRVPGWAPCVVTFSVGPTFTFPCCVHNSVLYWVHQCHFSGFHIYVLIYDTCYFLSDLLHSI